MNMLNKKLHCRKIGLLVLTALVLFAFVLPLQAQQRRNRNRKKELTIPSTALECPYTKEDILNKLNQFNAWIFAWSVACDKNDFKQLLGSWEKKLKNPQNYRISELKPFVFVPREQPEEKQKKQKKNRKKQKESQPETVSDTPKQEEGTFYYLTQRELLNHYNAFALFLKFPHLTDDLQEATRFDKEAFLRYDKVIRHLETVLKKMDDIRKRNMAISEFKKVFEMEFKPALKAAVLAFEQLQKTKRMSAEKRSALEEKNKERRRKAYIARMMREQAQQKVQPKQEEQ